MQIKCKNIVFIFLTILLLCFILSYGVYSHMQSKLQIDRTEFLGTFCIEDCSNKIIAIEGMNSDNLSDLQDYRIYYKSGKNIVSGKCKLTKNNYAVLYEGKEAIGTIFYTNEEFVIFLTGDECGKLKKLSDSPVFP